MGNENSTVIQHFDRNSKLIVPVIINTRQNEIVRYVKYLLIRGMRDSFNYPFIYNVSNKCQCVFIKKNKYIVEV